MRLAVKQSKTRTNNGGVPRMPMSNGMMRRRASDEPDRTPKITAAVATRHKANSTT